MILVVAVAIYGLSLLATVVALLMLNSEVQLLRKQVAGLAGQGRLFLVTAGRTMREDRKQFELLASGVSSGYETVHETVRRTKVAVLDAADRTQAQMNRLELVVNNTRRRYQEARAAVDAVRSPIREVTSLSRGVGTLLRNLRERNGWNTHTG